MALLLSSTGYTYTATAFSAQGQRCIPSSASSSSSHQYNSVPHHSHGTTAARKSTTSLSVIGTGAASIIAGSVGGAIGVGVAYPLDTLKTKSQVYAQERSAQQKQQQQQKSNKPPGVVCTDEDCYAIESPEENLVSLVKMILELEGVAGFYGGVKAMMIGQALIKSVAFSANTFALGVLASGVVEEVGGGTGVEETVAAGFVALLLAASFSGFVTSFLVAPVERVKVMMQAQQNSLYANELECAQAVIETEGWGGLFSRGLGPTLAREIPSYAIYFLVYGILMQTTPAENLGSVAPLVCGAISGCACWIPVYPIDVVKTLVQNTEGGGSDSAIDVAVQLYKDDGIGAFYNGLTPKMLRASVNHAVTFYVYALVMDALA